MIDFVNKPIQGFIKNPLEGGKGILEGSKSLLLHTTSGIFNSIAKISGTMGHVISTVSYDEEYQKKRELMKTKKPKNIVSGLE